MPGTSLPFFIRPSFRPARGHHPRVAFRPANAGKGLSRQCPPPQWDVRPRLEAITREGSGWSHPTNLYIVCISEPATGWSPSLVFMFHHLIFISSQSDPALFSQGPSPFSGALPFFPLLTRAPTDGRCDWPIWQMNAATCTVALTSSARHEQGICCGEMFSAGGKEGGEEQGSTNWLYRSNSPDSNFTLCMHFFSMQSTVG